MFQPQILCIALLVCFAYSEPADDEADTGRGKIWKTESNRKCYCGSLYLPDYEKESSGNIFQRKFRVLNDEINAMEKFKYKKFNRKCSCYKIREMVEGGRGMEKNFEDGYQIDKYQESTSGPFEYDTIVVQKVTDDYGQHLESMIKKNRQKRESEMDKVQGMTMNLEETKDKNVADITMRDTEEVFNIINKNKSAQVLEKIGQGLGVASNVVQTVGDQVGSTIGGKIAQSVLNQVSFGLGLASETARTLAESKRSSRKKK